MRVIATMTVVGLFALPLVATGADPLESWENTSTKASIIEFIDKVTDPESDDLIPINERIATFDNDGTLWSEYPEYFQLYFAFDVACDDQPPPTLSKICDKGREAVPNLNEAEILKLVLATHNDIAVESFQGQVELWLQTATHPIRDDLKFADMFYKPMQELLEYLRANQFKTFIVSGGGQDFVRVFSDSAYGIPPYQVTGSNTPAYYDADANVVNKATEEEEGPKAEAFFVDDKTGKPVGISTHIGLRPTFVVGNSDGDRAMTEYASVDGRQYFGLILHHTDEQREFAYDNGGSDDSNYSGPGRLTDDFRNAIEDEPNWHLIDMKEDWATVYGE